MVDTQTENQTPQYTTDEVISGLVVATTNVRDWLAWASQQVAQGNPEESQKALALVESQINELEVGISIASQMLAAAVDVGETLKAQRDEAIKERDNYGAEIDEMQCQMEMREEEIFGYAYESVMEDIENDPLQYGLDEAVDNAREHEEDWLLKNLRSRDPGAAETLENTLTVARESREQAEKLKKMAQDTIYGNTVFRGLPVSEAMQWDDSGLVDEEESEDLDTDEYGEGDPDA